MEVYVPGVCTGSVFSYTASACPSAGAVHAPTNICHTGETICVLFRHASFVSVSVFVCVEVSERV